MIKKKRIGEIQTSSKKGVEDIPRTGDGVSKIIKTSAQGTGSQAETEGSSGR